MPLPATYSTSRGIQNHRGRRISQSAIIHDIFTNVAAPVANGWSLSHVGQSAAGTTEMTLGGSLAVAQSADYARNVVITVTHASAVVAMSGTITGYDMAGLRITEAWSVTAGTTSKVFTGAKTFKRVTSITETIAATAAGNTIVAGTGKVLGLQANVSPAGVLAETVNGTLVTTGTVVVSSTSSTADPRGTYSPAGTPGGTDDYEVWYISDTPELSP